jgi:hypothetical protein
MIQDQTIPTKKSAIGLNEVMRGLVVRSYTVDSDEKGKAARGTGAQSAKVLLVAVEILVDHELYQRMLRLDARIDVEEIVREMRNVMSTKDAVPVVIETRAEDRRREGVPVGRRFQIRICRRSETQPWLGGDEGARALAIAMNELVVGEVQALLKRKGVLPPSTG